jgi:RNA polymerase sigma-70 factor (ECF subfamily)
MREAITEEQFRTIYRDTVTVVYTYAARRCGGVRELAEDVTQEVWLRAVRDWRKHGAPDNPIAWLTTVARNLILNHQRRHEGVSLDLVSPMEVLAAVENNTVSDSAEITALVSQALTHLPHAEAELLESFHYDRSKTSELAEAHGVSERTIERRLKHARERLRNQLEILLKAERGIA